MKRGRLLKSSVSGFFSLSAILLLISICPARAAVKAFPEAEGFGAGTVGGRGGKVIFVSNLNDSGPGSLREAIDAKGPRVVIFRVSGTIELQKDLGIRNPYITIAGQTAPGDGICLKNYALEIKTDEVIVRHLRVRPGDAMKKELDAISIGECRNVILDHCSASWAIDETLSANGFRADNITVQWCIISESLNESYHKKGKHGYGSLIVGASGGFSFHHNLYIHHNSRNPRPGGKEGAVGPVLDFRNNLIYNWGHRAGYNSQTGLRMNYIGNCLKPGPSTQESVRQMAFLVGGEATRIYADGNKVVGFPEADQNNWLAFSPNKEFLQESDLATKIKVDTPLPCPAMPAESAESACQRILEQAGAALPKRDAVDQRLADEVKNNGGKIINSQNEVGGWPLLEAAPAPSDRDNDALPDEWERAHGLKAEDASDQYGDSDQDGYSNLEEWINGTDPASR